MSIEVSRLFLVLVVWVSYREFVLRTEYEKTESPVLLGCWVDRCWFLYTNVVENLGGCQMPRRSILS